MKIDKKVTGDALTFDDVLLIPNYSTVLPRETDSRTRLSTKVRLNIPLVSAAMDTVTEGDLAIALAREGGIGIIHKNFTIEQQANEVSLVKRSESGMIDDPVKLEPDRPVHEAIALMNKYHISGIPIVNGERLVGMLTNRDLRFVDDHDRSISEFMTKEHLITAKVGTTLEEAERILQRHKIEKLPVVDSSGKLRGMITYKDIQKKKSFPNACKDDRGRLRVGAAVGVKSETIERVEALVKAGVDIVIVDTAHGHSRGVINMVKTLKKKFPQLQLIAGNVGTKEGTVELIKAGVDGVKVGIGPGSICTTRIVAGIGIPQITAVMECSAAAAKYDIPIIADGGIKQTGDIAKAIAAGADCVMIGNLFAGVEESPVRKSFTREELTRLIEEWARSKR